ncbi:hypothetical protein [Neobacillus mesonae]|uniref:Exodeoxyribonuclease X-like C-terminal domain-containing protein n=1 Tax=Neobacillus mesonae TaxID=1193713 RepID=A0A3Q9QXT2_9BACI|nr:hypothetical protein [Neobacillus mesonae]AZU64411.1 hypothetical protein CHR53_26015 [Neobacillus mesonae]
MNFSFGKYKGKPVAWVVIEDPDYISWFIRQEMKHRKEYGFSIEIIKRFDEIPFSNASCCARYHCQNPVEYLCLYDLEYSGENWVCDYCDPWSLWVRENKLTTVNKYEETIGLRNRAKIIKAFARAKGLPERITEKGLREFFCIELSSCHRPEN